MSIVLFAQLGKEISRYLFNTGVSNWQPMDRMRPPEVIYYVSRSFLKLSENIENCENDENSAYRRLRQYRTHYFVSPLTTEDKCTRGSASEFNWGLWAYINSVTTSGDV